METETNTMKTLFLRFAILMFVVRASEAEIVHYQPFSTSVLPSWFRHTAMDTTFGERWSIASFLAGDPAQQYARFVISIPVLPTNPEARWYGGFHTFLAGMTNLPPDWQLSFRACLTNLEPLCVRFDTADTLWPVFGQPPPPLPVRLKTLTLWCYPRSTGWQTLRFDRNSASLAGQVGGPTDRLGTFFRIGLASHGPDAQPLSIAHVGNHALSLDEITFSAGPAPSILTVNRTATNTLVVSWPSTLDGVNLETNGSLSAPQWSDWIVSPSDDGTNKTAVVAPTGPLFFRVRN